MMSETVEEKLAAVIKLIVKLDERFQQLQTKFAQFIERKPAKEWYTTSEVAAIVVRKRFTVREWCRLGRVSARKRPCGRGKSQDWIISHGEVQRIVNEGLLPDPFTYRHPR